MRVLLIAIATLVSMSSVACTVGEDADLEQGGVNADVGDTEPLVPGDDDAVAPEGFNTTFQPNDVARVCNASALNQRSGAGTNNPVVKLIPAGSSVKVVAQEGTWVKNEWSGSTGWSSAQYLCSTEDAGPTPGGGGNGLSSTTVSRSSFVSIAAASVGFSYYWGGGALKEGGARGACYGSCPNCTHSGSYGADCSGYLGKVWLLPQSLPMAANKHPYSTASFAGAHSLWKSQSRSSLLQGDALVYRSGGAGHIVMYDKGDNWGSFWTYEARGCSYGIVHNIRTAGSAYKGIRRTGV